MQRLFIFAIGGTGTRVLRSFTMLLASGQKIMEKYDVYPIILDYDETNGDTEIATKCIENYHAIHNIIWKDRNLSEDNLGFFKSNLCQLKNQDNEFDASAFRMIYAPKGDNIFKQYIDYDALGKSDRKDADTTNSLYLLQSLYNTDPLSDDAELNLKMDVGFKGNPNIGSLIFHDIDTDCEEFRNFLLNLADNDRVIVIGSLFGGTGSSGIPEIIRKINKKKPNVKTGALLVMPYFSPKDKAGGTIRHEIFNSKTKAAINYYVDSGIIDFDSAGHKNTYNGRRKGMLDSVYFVGDPKRTVLEYCDGGTEQVNPANPVEYACALSILHFADDNDGCYKYGVNQFLIGDKISVKNLTYRDLYQSQDFVEPIFQRMASFTVAMKYFMFRTMDPKPERQLRNTVYYSRFSINNPRENMAMLIEQLKLFWDKYKKWLDELSNKDVPDDKGNIHSLSLFSTESNLDILLADSSLDSQSKRKENKSVEGRKIDAIINEDIKTFKPKGMSGEYITDDEEFLFMHGLYSAAIDQKDVLDKLFS